MYVKLFSKILDSSIWMEPPTTKVVWLTLLAAMDQDGFAHFASIKNLAQRAVVSIKEAEAAIACLANEDPDSSNPEHGGKRVERVPGGFMVLNAASYRKIKDREMEREHTRIRTAKYRERLKCDGKTSHPVTIELQAVTKNHKARGTIEDITTYCVEIGLPTSDGQWFFDKCEGCGWINGSNPIKDWKATIRQWKLAGHMNSQKNNGPPKGPNVPLS